MNVYKKLMKIKGENKSFSDLFLRLLKIQKKMIKKSFGNRNLSDKEKKEIWGDIIYPPERRWKKIDIREKK